MKTTTTLLLLKVTGTIIVWRLSAPVTGFSPVSHNRRQGFKTNHRTKPRICGPNIEFVNKKHASTAARVGTSSSDLSMALLPMPVSDLSRCLVLGVPTGEQYGTYWGRTSREQYNAMFESASVTFLGLFASYFLSFVVGTPVATFLGFFAAFWVLLGPEFKAYQRNWELVGGRDLVDPWVYDDDDDDDLFASSLSSNNGLYGAYYIASVENVAVVSNINSPTSDEYPLSEFEDYTMEQDDAERVYGEPWILRLLISDRSGRSMQVHARMSEEYLDVQVGMPCVCVLLSTDKQFEVLSALTEFFIPDATCYVGDYPYLDKFHFARLFEENALFQIMEDEDTRLECFEDDSAIVLE